MIPLPDAESPTGIKISSMIGVLWDEVRSPAPSYHDPSELIWLSVPDIAEEEDEDEDEESEETEDEVDDSEESEEDESDE